MKRYVLAVGGSDSSGGAGIQADIRTITSLGAHAFTAATAVTAQNSRGVLVIHRVPARVVLEQIQAVLHDLAPDAVKIGMLLSGTTAREVARVVKRNKLSCVVLDPVLRASTGKALLEPAALSVLKKELLPVVSVVTPNLDEAQALSGKRVKNLKDMEEASKFIKGMGPDVVITGGHLSKECVDLFYDGKEFHRFRSSKIRTKYTHGTGCVFSSALATFLALGYNTFSSAKKAHDFTRQAIKEGYPSGRGTGTLCPEKAAGTL
ncbi:MAG: bifunctional hydroxymethylpyrimidine kinase/phosphomethylpyrimidine kinase [Deltaproteobacteria bacterium]|nr:bifunctional hydroxymethylpyrimidine kinase/phosphomethylpyrimidine kinase [Deltaproteobacteria bacterium]